MLTLSDALSAAHSVIEAATEENVAVAVAICDGKARLRVFLKMDDAPTVLMGHEAMRRAIHSACTGAASDDPSKPVPTSMVEQEGIGGSTRPGGLPCLRHNELIGSIGVAGVDGELCVRLATVGVKALANSSAA